MACVRNIVTATCEDGIARVISDGLVTALLETGGGGSVREVWRTTSLSARTVVGEAASVPLGWSPDFAPAAGGSSCRIVTIPPDSQRWAQPGSADTVSRAIGANRPAAWVERHPGMHVTSSLDYSILLSGRLTMVMEDGEVDLAPGDVVVQQAAAHAWKNAGTEPAVMFVVMIGLIPDQSEI